MSLEKIRGELSSRLQNTNQEPPESCVGCPNLASLPVGTGRVVLSCLLERADSQMTGPRDQLAETGATAEWVARALSVADLDPETTKDRGAIKFRERAAVANDGCPVLENVLEQLPKATRNELIDLKPPEPLLEYEDLRVVIGLDEPRS